MKSLRNTLKRIKSKKDVEADGAKEPAKVEKKEEKQRPPFRPRPQMIIGYTHDSINEAAKKLTKDAEGLSSKELSSLPQLLKDFDKILEVIRVHHNQESKTYFPLIKESVENAKDDIDAIVHAHDDDEKQFVSIRSELNTAVVAYHAETGEVEKKKDGDDKQGEESNETAKAKSSVKVDELKKSLKDFASSQAAHIKLEEALYNKVTPKLFQPAEKAGVNMKKVLDTDRADFGNVLLPFLTAHIIGTTRSGKLRQLIDSVQRSSSVEDFRKYREYFKSKIQPRLWTKLCKLGYDKDLPVDDKKAEAKKDSPKKIKPKAALNSRKSLRVKLRAGDTVAFHDSTSGERRTGEVLEMIDGGAKLVLKVQKQSELHKEPLELVIYIEKNLCKKVVSIEALKKLTEAAETAEKEKAAKKEEETKEAGEKPKAEDKKKDDKPASTEEAKEAEPGKAAEKEVEVRVESPADGSFALLTLANEALRLAVADIAARLKDLKADDKDGLAALKKDYDAFSACTDGRFALEDDKFVSKYVATNRVGDLKDERKYDGTVRKGISDLLGKASDEASIKKLTTEYNEWAEDFRGALKREEALFNTGSPDAEDVRYSLQESVKRERDAFDKAVEPFVSAKLEGALLEKWQKAVKSVA